MHHFDEQIEDYLLNELDPASRAAFENALQQDSALREAVEAHRDLLARLEAYKLRKTVKQNIEWPPPAPVPYASGKIFRLATATAALLVLATGIWWLLSNGPATLTPAETARQAAGKDTLEKSATQPPTAQTTPADTPRPTQATPTPKTTNNKVHIACMEAIQRLELLNFNTMGREQPDSTAESRLNKAIALLKNGKPTPATTLLNGILRPGSTGHETYRDDAEWLLTLAALLQDAPAGQKLLEAIIQNPAHPYRSDAIRLAGRLH